MDRPSAQGFGREGAVRVKAHPGSFRLAYAREIYDALGPVTEADVYRVRWMGETARRRYFHNVYGWQAARIALEEYRRLTKR